MKDIHFHIMEPHSLLPERLFQMPTQENAEMLVRALDVLGLRQACIPSISLYDPVDFVCNPLALYAKTLAPGRVYALAGLRYGLKREENAHLREQAEALLQAGFDGFKMICKPNARRVMRFPIDDPMFEEFFAAAEKNQWPILFHVGDPASFWDAQAVPSWAIENGWFYGGDANIPSYAALYKEVDALLNRHPLLRVTFAHFFFPFGQPSSRPGNPGPVSECAPRRHAWKRNVLRLFPESRSSKGIL